jgi:hypothetical protein
MGGSRAWHCTPSPSIVAGVVGPWECEWSVWQAVGKKSTAAAGVIKFGDQPASRCFNPSLPHARRDATRF